MRKIHRDDEERGKIVANKCLFTSFSPFLCWCGLFLDSLSFIGVDQVFRGDREANRLVKLAAERMNQPTQTR